LSNKDLQTINHHYDNFDNENMTNVNSKMKIIGV